MTYIMSGTPLSWCQNRRGRRSPSTTSGISCVLNRTIESMELLILIQQKPLIFWRPLSDWDSSLVQFPIFGARLFARENLQDSETSAFDPDLNPSRVTWTEPWKKRIVILWDIFIIVRSLFFGCKHLQLTPSWCVLMCADTLSPVEKPAMLREKAKQIIPTMEKPRATAFIVASVGACKWWAESTKMYRSSRAVTSTAFE